MRCKAIETKCALNKYSLIDFYKRRLMDISGFSARRSRTKSIFPCERLLRLYFSIFGLPQKEPLCKPKIYIIFGNTLLEH